MITRQALIQTPNPNSTREELALDTELNRLTMHNQAKIYYTFVVPREEPRVVLRTFQKDAHLFIGQMSEEGREMLVLCLLSLLEEKMAHTLVVQFVRLGRSFAVDKIDDPTGTILTINEVPTVASR